jgi:hypothetical protein
MAVALDDVVEELYGVAPADFVAQRDAAVKAARADGDKALAKAIAGLRRPSRPAWVLNQLVRAEPGALDELAALGDELREAEREMRGPELRRLSTERNRLLDRLVGGALRAAGVGSGDAELQREVQETLTAALAEPAVLDGLRSGALVKPVAWSGFGVSVPDDLTAVPVPPGGGRERRSAGSGRDGRPEPTAGKPGRRLAAAAEPDEEPDEPDEDAAPSRSRGRRSGTPTQRRESGRERAAERERERRQREHDERVAEAERDLAEAEVVYAAAKAEAADTAAEVARLEAALRDARSEASSAAKESNAARKTRDTARTTLTRVRARRP